MMPKKQITDLEQNLKVANCFQKIRTIRKMLSSKSVPVRAVMRQHCLLRRSTVCWSNMLRDVAGRLRC